MNACEGQSPIRPRQGYQLSDECIRSGLQALRPSREDQKGKQKRSAISSQTSTKRNGIIANSVHQSKAALYPERRIIAAERNARRK